MAFEQLKTPKTVESALTKNNLVLHYLHSSSESKKCQMPRLTMLDREININLELEQGQDTFKTDNGHIP